MAPLDRAMLATPAFSISAKLNKLIVKAQRVEISLFWQMSLFFSKLLVSSAQELLVLHVHPLFGK